MSMKRWRTWNTANNYFLTSRIQDCRFGYGTMWSISKLGSLDSGRPKRFSRRGPLQGSYGDLATLFKNDEMEHSIVEVRVWWMKTVKKLRWSKIDFQKKSTAFRGSKHSCTCVPAGPVTEKSLTFLHDQFDGREFCAWSNIFNEILAAFRSSQTNRRSDRSHSGLAQVLFRPGYYPASRPRFISKACCVSQTFQPGFHC